MDWHLTLEQIRSLAGPDAEEAGSYTGPITGMAGLAAAQAGQLSYLPNLKVRQEVRSSRASVVLVPREYDGQPPPGVTYFRVGHPAYLLAVISRLVEVKLFPRPAPGIHPGAVVHPSARVDPTAWVGPGCVLGEGAEVGAGADLRAQVYVGREAAVGAESWLAPFVCVGDYCRVGARCRLHSGVVLGSDGFGFLRDHDTLTKIPQIGRVELADEVEIGANTTVDRARFGVTRIGRGTKIDNQVQIGHDAQIGEYNYLAGQVSLAGDAEVGNWTIILGQTCVDGGAKIGDRARIGAQSGVARAVPPGADYQGRPAIEMHTLHRVLTLLPRLPELFRQMRALEGRVGRLEKPGSRENQGG